MTGAREFLKSCMVPMALLLVTLASPASADDAGPASELAAPVQAPSSESTPPVASSLPIRFFSNIHLRYDFTRNEDPLDLLLDRNQIDGFLVRLRFGLTFRDENSTLSGGLRFSAGETPNPAAPFIRLGDAFRPVTFNLDQFYIDVRPFRNKARVHGIFGKMPLPFWRGDRGAIRNEMTWDDDVSPVGGAAQVRLFGTGEGAQQIALENTAGYFIVEWLRDDRFEGLVGDISLSADQLKLTVKRFAAAVAYYHWQNLNSGARAPNFVPGQSAFVLPGRSAFLLRPGFQITNATIDLGSGVHVFRENEFDIFEATGQASVPATVPLLGRSEVVALATYTHNVSVENENKGVGISLGLVGGNAKMRLKPYSVHGTWRRVEADAALATFADSDIGAGTDVKGFEITGDYRVHQNLSLTVSHFNFDGSPKRSINIKRTFLGMVLDF